MGDSAKIPERLNWLLLVTVAPLTWGLLYGAAHGGLVWLVLCAWWFALLHNTLFCLLHESVHGVFSPNRFRNDVAGVLAAAMFPTAYSLQRIAHLGHHKRNRSDEELYDYYLPHQSKRLRNLWLYGGNLMGMYWFLIPLSNLIYWFCPWYYTSRGFIEGPARWLGFEPYVREIAEARIGVIWWQCTLAVCYQVGLFVFLDLTWLSWLACHWAFALHWSALQYVDHAWSPRHVTEGAWDLRVSAPARWLALNYHYHLAHHRHPGLPWIHLPARVDRQRPRPGFWQIYFSLWGGVRPAPACQYGGDQPPP